MRVAVTGASGYIGTNLVPRLCADGHDVVAIDRVLPPRPDAGPRWIAADVTDLAAMTEALRGVETVFHLAAVITLAADDPVAWRVNTEGVRVTGRAALVAGVRRMVHCGSVHSFDERTPHLDERSPRAEDPSLPIYDRSKWRGEQLLQQVVADGLDAVICNPTGVFGPVDPALSRVNGVIRDAARGRVPVAVSGAFDMVDVRDVVAGLLAASQRGRTGQNYLLPGHLLTMTQMCRAAAAENGRRGPLFAVPARLVRGISPLIDPVVRCFGSDAASSAAMAALLAQPQIDGGKARSELGFVARPASETIRDLVSYLRDTRRL